MSDAVDILPGAGPLVLTCEHASSRVPPGFGVDGEGRWPEEDAWLTDTHWVIDLGIADLTRELAMLAGWPAVLARFTRLLVDLNREEGHPDLFRATADGRPVALNADLDDAERERRLAALYRPYHAAVDASLAERPGAAVVSMHSFSPLYEGQRRTLEAGVLFDEHEDIARAVHADLLAAGLDVRQNEPWSGKAGLIHAAQVHGRRHDRVYIELEFRQDLLADPAFRRRVVEILARVLPQRLGG